MARIEWQEALAMERDVAILLQKQAKKGIYFDSGKARYFTSLLESKKEEEYLEIRPYLDYEVINEELKNKEYDPLDPDSYPFNYVKKIKNKNGSYTKQVISYYDDCSIILGPFSRISIEEPSISKRQLIVNQLLKHGWKPTEFTEKGFPQLTIKGEPVESLLSVGPFGQSLANWYIYNHRQSQIKGFLEHIRSDGRISSIMTGLTNTFRHKHKVVANIPRPTSVFGKEMRSLFCATPGNVMVNADLSGLELRMLAHHMNDSDYIDQILNGDIHTYNQKKAGLATRDMAKTFIYAFL